MSPDLKQHIIEVMWGNAVELYSLLSKNPLTSQETYLHDVQSVHDRCHLHCRVIQELGCHNDSQFSNLYDQIDTVATKAGEILQENN